MDYHAAFLREPGEKLNNDGLMIKGFHTETALDVVIMVLSTDKRNGKLSDKVVRTAEKIINKKGKNCELLLEKLFCKYCKRNIFRWRNDTDLTILILKGINYYVLNSGKNRVVRVGRLGIEDISAGKSEESKDGNSILATSRQDNVDIEKRKGKGFNENVSFCAKGRLTEGSTIVAGNEAFFERQLGTDIHKRLCPQMCVGSESMQNNMDYLGKLLFSRGEERPVTAAAVCVR